MAESRWEWGSCLQCKSCTTVQTSQTCRTVTWTGVANIVGWAIPQKVHCWNIGRFTLMATTDWRCSSQRWVSARVETSFYTGHHSQHKTRQPIWQAFHTSNSDTIHFLAKALGLLLHWWRTTVIKLVTAVDPHSTRQCGSVSCSHQRCKANAWKLMVCSFYIDVFLLQKWLL